ncbi:MAG: ribosomal protein S18-alanine N-acetyltransferase [Dokdonella sp.]
MRMEDVDLIAMIERSAYPYPWTSGIIRDCLRAGYDCWLLVADDETVGYGIVSVAADEAHLLNICISPSHQGYGYGRQLLLGLVQLARRRKAERLYLEVRPSNERAIALYKTAGFCEVGRRPRYYPAADDREDAIVLTLELQPEAG